MTEDDRKLLHTLEARVRHLMLMHKELTEKNAALEQKLKEEQELRGLLELNYQKLEASYNHLKTAKIISVGDDDSRDTRQRLSKLVREIDKCIALLNN